jgi:phosphoglycolate phosphatase
MIRVLRKFDPHAIRLLIFDLDGTLIDSRLDLIHSVNATLRHFERPELEGNVIASYVGDGAPALVRRALFGHADDGTREGEDAALFRNALDYFLGYYRMHKLDHTTVYEGSPEVLRGLANGTAVAGATSVGATSVGPTSVGATSAGATNAGATNVGATGVGMDKSVPPTRVMAVLSNKPVRPSQDIVQSLGLGDYFVRIYGGNSFATKKPDPLGARTLLEETATAPEQALMIGDSGIDVQTGRNAGVWTCGVTYGFAPHTLEEVVPDVLVDGPRELGQMFE